jgi:hypothetical protein
MDWQVRAASPPYESIQELMLEYQLGVHSRESLGVEIIAHCVAQVVMASQVRGTSADVRVFLGKGLERKKLRLGYRVLSQQKVHSRASIDGDKMEWATSSSQQEGHIKIEIPDAAFLHCFVSYDGVSQHYGWLGDSTNAPNPRRVAYESFDDSMTMIKSIVADAQNSRKNARQLEVAVSWLLWMLGFSVAHLGGTPRMSDAVDLLATSPQGHIAVIECTTGILKAENKLAILHERAQSVRRRLDASNFRHLRLLTVIVTSKSRNDILPDLEQAEKLGILVYTKEDLDAAYDRTFVMPDADQLYEQAERRVQAAKARHEAVTGIV